MTLARKAPMRRTPVKKKKPSAKETTRSMGTLARRKFVASLPCAACGVVGYSVSAHLLGNGGMGRKKHHTTTGPLCGPRFSITGCHHAYDEEHSWFVALFPWFVPEAIAAETERAWQAHLAGGLPTQHEDAT